jgi:hypothetical protein
MCAADDSTLIDIQEIESRCYVATRGPWESYVVGRDTEAGMNCIATGESGSMEIIGGTVADQDFIAHAREDIPRLVIEVRRLRTALVALQAARTVVGAHVGERDARSRDNTRP